MSYFLAPALVALRNDLNKKYPKRDKKIVMIDSVPAEIDENFQPEVEIFLLNGDLHPPVTGGKNAISSPGLSGALATAMS